MNDTDLDKKVKEISEAIDKCLQKYVGENYNKGLVALMTEEIAQAYPMIPRADIRVELDPNDPSKATFWLPKPADWIDTDFTILADGTIQEN